MDPSSSACHLPVEVTGDQERYRQVRYQRLSDQVFCFEQMLNGDMC